MNRKGFFKTLLGGLGVMALPSAAKPEADGAWKTEKTRMTPWDWHELQALKVRQETLVAQVASLEQRLLLTGARRRVERFRDGDVLNEKRLNAMVDAINSR